MKKSDNDHSRRKGGLRSLEQQSRYVVQWKGLQEICFPYAEQDDEEDKDQAVPGSKAGCTTGVDLDIKQVAKRNRQR